MKSYLTRFTLYLTILGITLFALLGIITLNSQNVMVSSSMVSNMSQVDWLTNVWHELAKNMKAPIPSLLGQILIILLFSRVCSFVLKLLGQPQVIGEMIAGILLGKSVLGFLWPEGFSTLFPDSSMPRLYFLSQLGLILFMFVVGLDLKVSELKHRASAAILVSHVSIAFPFILGALISIGLYERYSSPDVLFSSFCLFMGIAMSITAFPVLARILQEKQLINTKLGAMAITCAAVDDVTAWCLLAAILGIVKAGTITTALGVLGISIVYVVVMLKIIKPLASKVLRKATIDGKFSKGQLPFIFSVLLGSALVAEIIGIHALFGAFLAGAVMPQSFSFRVNLTEKIKDVSLIILLPIFFAYTGIRTEINLLNGWEAWLTCGGIIVVAIVGKMFGSAFAARWSGMSWQESWALGSLMNTRGLMELVVLNIGYDIGILSPTIFTMMVVMALVTTAMTGPLLTLTIPQLRSQRLEKFFGMKLHGR